MSRPTRYQFPLANLLSVYSQHPFVQTIQQRTKSVQTSILQPSKDNPTSNQPINPNSNPTNQPTNQPAPAQSRRYLFTGQVAKDFGARMRQHPFLNRESQPDKGQDMSRQPKKRATQAAQIDGRWNRCTNCRKEYTPYDSKVCPWCNFPVPDFIYNARPTGHSNLSISRD